LSLDYSALESMRVNHPAWRLLRADQSPLIISFFNRVFVIPNNRVMAQSKLVEHLENELYALRDRGITAHPKSALEYLNDWTAIDKGWLRKFYRQGTDEPYFDLTPSAEKVISWLNSLTERSFVGTESRLLTLFELLKQMSERTQTNPEVRIAELQKRKDELDVEIKKLRNGEIDILDDTALKDRFQQFTGLARDLLSDFREVEHNFRGLDRRVREKIALWESNKGSLLEMIMIERDAIDYSDQGRSFHAFWDFLMSTARQEELTNLLDQVLSLPAIAKLEPDSRLRLIHYDWLEAGDHTQRTVALLSQQLRRFLDDSVWLENSRIMKILKGIEVKAVELRGASLPDEIMSVACLHSEIDLLMERPLFKPAVKSRITEKAINAQDGDVDATALFNQIIVDTKKLKNYIEKKLEQRSQITLSELLDDRPLERGLAEIVAYLQLATSAFEAVVDETVIETVTWNSEDGALKRARLPRVIFTRLK
jgi:hypothetical protein